MRNKRKSNKTRSDLSIKKRKLVTKKKAILRRIKTPKTRNQSTLTESEYFSKIRSALRRAFRWWKPMMTTLEEASRPYTGPNKKQKKEFQCNTCKKWFKRTGVQIDHILECGSLSCYDDIVPFLKRLTREEKEAYQVLCRPCHKVKTSAYLKNKKEKNGII